MIYIPKWYTPKELFPPEIATPKTGEFDPRNWRRFDERILKMFDQIREDHGPITGNEGNLTGCGFRYPSKQIDVVINHDNFKELIGKHRVYDRETLSQHTFGRAIDGHPKEKTAQEIRFNIIRNPERYPHIRFLEIDISWLHGDARNNGGVLQLWSPKRGFVSSDEYLKWGDK